MNKTMHQVRAKHCVKIMNECINSGMSKTAWCRANGISEKQVLLLAEDIAQGSFREFPEFIITGNCRNAAGTGSSDPKGGLFYRDQASIFYSEHSSGFSFRPCDSKRQSHSGAFDL